MSITLPFSKEIWEQKYRYKDETIEEFYKRISNSLANEFLNEEELYEQLYSQKFSLAGRPMYSLGTEREGTTLSNCFVIPIKEDSMEGIMEAQREFSVTLKAGGGVGSNFSILRPKNATINSTGNSSSGAVSWLFGFNAYCEYIKAGNSRRGAMIAVLNVWHPDIEEFINVKKTKGALTNFNISVGITDAFMEAVKKNQNWNLVFPDTKHPDYNRVWNGDLNLWGDRPVIVYKTVKARSLWEQIMEATYEYAEPGVLFLDTINKNNPLNYFETIQSTNPSMPGNTLVWTHKGIKKLEDLENLDLIVKGIQGDMSPARCFKSGENVVVDRLYLDDDLVTNPIGNYLDATPQHTFPVITEMGIVKKLTKDLKVGDKIFFDKSSTLDFDNEVSNEISNDGFRKGYSYAFKNTTKGTDIEILLDSSFSYITSFLDGLYSINGYLDGLSLKVSVANTKDALLLSKIFSFLGIRAFSVNNSLTATVEIPLIEDIKRFDSLVKITNPLLNRKLEILNYNYINVESTSYRTITRIKRAVKTCDVYDISVFDDFHAYQIEQCYTGNCGEIPLGSYGSCNLGAINLSKFVKYPFTDNASIDLEDLTKTIIIGVKALNQVLKHNYYPLSEFENQSNQNWLVGLGIMGLADMLAMLKLPYDSDKALDTADRLAKHIRDTAYHASVGLTANIGKFKNFNEEYSTTKYFKELPEELQKAIMEKGIANGRLLTIAPTGTTSIIANNASGGVEPYFSLGYIRNVKQPDGTTVSVRVEPYGVSKFKEMFPGVELPEYFSESDKISPEAHLKMQAVFQKYIDNSISKTINCSADIPFEEFEDIYLTAYKLGCKGCTTYRPSNIRDAVLKKESEIQVIPNMPIEFEVEGIRLGKTFPIKGKNGETNYVTINVDEHNDPKELFFKLQKEAAKDDQGNFHFGIWADRMSDVDAIARLISLCLRSSIPLERVVHQLEKASYSMFCLPHLIKNCLMDFLSEDSATEPCPKCQGRLVFQEGCQTCIDCGYSKCS